MTHESVIQAGAEFLVDRFSKRGMKVALAESCTGGMIAAAITSVPGASKVFEYGIVAYANSVKERELGVPAQTLLRYGAVSKETVEAMARGALAKSGADIAIAVSGIAGPDGGTPEKPVGTVWLALATKQRVWSETHRFGGERADVRALATYEALAMVVRHFDSI